VATMKLVAKIWKCQVCGKEERQERGQERPKHRDCGMSRMLDSIKQIREKQGPIYKRWDYNLRRSKGRLTAIEEAEAFLTRERFKQLLSDWDKEGQNE